MGVASATPAVVDAHTGRANTSQFCGLSKPAPALRRLLKREKCQVT